MDSFFESQIKRKITAAGGRISNALRKDAVIDVQKVSNSGFWVSEGRTDGRISWVKRRRITKEFFVEFHKIRQHFFKCNASCITQISLLFYFKKFAELCKSLWLSFYYILFQTNSPNFNYPTKSGTLYEKQHEHKKCSM